MADLSMNILKHGGKKLKVFARLTDTIYWHLASFPCVNLPGFPNFVFKASDALSFWNIKKFPTADITHSPILFWHFVNHQAAPLASLLLPSILLWFEPQWLTSSSKSDNHGQQAPHSSYSHYSVSLKAKPHRNYLLGFTENSKLQKEFGIEEEL